MKEEKIYIVPGNLNQYFQFIHRLYMFKFIKRVSKELQVLIIHPDQIRGIQGKVLVLTGAYENQFYDEIRLQLQLRGKVLQVHECSPEATLKDLSQVFLK